MAIVCLKSSVVAKNGYEYCAESDAITIPSTPAPDNCADYPALSLLAGSILEWCAVGLFILPPGVSLFLKWKNDYSEDSYTESIKIIG